MRSDGSFYNAATANPVNYIGKAFATNYGLQFDVALPDGKLAIGITVAACASCDLNGDPTTVEGNEYFSISCIPHRGIWERMQSFHALMSGASEIQGQVVKNILSFQTRAASFSNSRSYGMLSHTSFIYYCSSFTQGPKLLSHLSATTPASWKATSPLPSPKCPLPSVRSRSTGFPLLIVVRRQVCSLLCVSEHHLDYDFHFPSSHLGRTLGRNYLHIDWIETSPCHLAHIRWRYH